MEEYEISCFKPQSKNSFLVYIEKTQKVDRLKDKIKEKMPHTLATVEADLLELYRINAFGNNLQERRRALDDEIRRIEDIRKASSDSELDNLESLDVVFDNTPPPDKTIHILVVVPSGEPIGYCARGDVAAMGLLSLPYHTPLPYPPTILHSSYHSCSPLLPR